jgi:ferredoxin
VRIVVDDELCALHAQCVQAAPDLFRIDDDGALQYVADVPAGQEADAELATSVCPAAAIEVEP